MLDYVGLEQLEGGRLPGDRATPIGRGSLPDGVDELQGVHVQRNPGSHRPHTCTTEVSLPFGDL